jgi:hypothetical protein
MLLGTTDNYVSMRQEHQFLNTCYMKFMLQRVKQANNKINARD